MIALIGVAVVATVLYGLVKRYSPEYAVLVETGAIVLLLWMAYPRLCDVIDFFWAYAGSSGISSDYLKIVIKSLGIAVLTQFSADLCRDAGESALGAKVEFAGKLMIAVLAIPLAKALLELALGLIQKQ